MSIGSLQEIPVSQLFYNNIDRNADDIGKETPGINAIAASLKKVGLISPLVVKDMKNGTFQILAGKRRFIASQVAGFEKLKCHVLEGDIHPSIVILADNLYNRNIHDIKRAETFKKLLDEGVYPNQTALAEACGVSQSYISRHIALLDTNPQVQAALIREELTKTDVLSAKKLTKENDELIAGKDKPSTEEKLSKIKEIAAAHKRRKIPDEFLLSTTGKRNSERFNVFLLGESSIELRFKFEPGDFAKGLKVSLAEEIDLIGEEQLTKCISNYKDSLANVGS